VSDPRELAKLLRRMFGSASGARILPVTNILDQSADALERLASIEQARAADMSELAKRAAMIDVAKICERLMVAEHDRDAFDSARVALVAENDGLCARIAKLEAALSKEVAQPRYGCLGCPMVDGKCPHCGNELMP
jgi:hypothetical protein